MLVGAVLIVVANLVVDILYSFLDPRVSAVDDRADQRPPRRHGGAGAEPGRPVPRRRGPHGPVPDRTTAWSRPSPTCRYTVERGKTLGIVGESGSGKCVSSMAVLGLHDPKRDPDVRLDPRRRHRGASALSERARCASIRGNDVAMIFQDPLTALHPFYIDRRPDRRGLPGPQQGLQERTPSKRAIEMLDRVGIPQPNRRVDDYPHQFSGGMRQRAMIAMALVNDPQLLIADEPTTALDVTVQAQILDLLQDLQREFNSAIIIITHDLGVVAEMADDVLVMYAGRAVEYGADQGDPDPPGDALHLGPALERPGRQRRHRRPADPDPGQPAEPAQPADRLPVPPAVRAHATRCPATCAGPRCPSCVPGRARREPPQALPPGQPGRDLHRGDPAGDRARI